jgi:hypothetical protein
MSWEELKKYCVGKGYATHLYSSPSAFKCVLPEKEIMIYVYTDGKHTADEIKQAFDDLIR